MAGGSVERFTRRHALALGAAATAAALTPVVLPRGVAAASRLLTRPLETSTPAEITPLIPFYDTTAPTFRCGGKLVNKEAIGVSIAHPDVPVYFVSFPGEDTIQAQIKKGGFAADTDKLMISQQAFYQHFIGSQITYHPPAADFIMTDHPFAYYTTVLDPSVSAQDRLRQFLLDNARLNAEIIAKIRSQITTQPFTYHEGILPTYVWFLMVNQTTDTSSSTIYGNDGGLCNTTSLYPAPPEALYGSVQVTRNDFDLLYPPFNYQNAAASTIAHELGHVFFGSAHHDENPQDVMRSIVNNNLQVIVTAVDYAGECINPTYLPLIAELRRLGVAKPLAQLNMLGISSSILNRAAHRYSTQALAASLFSLL